MGTITIEWPSNTDLVLPECYITVPEELEGTLSVYTVPGPNDLGVAYQVFINTGTLEQRPTCASEKSKLIVKYSFSTLGDNSIEPLYLLNGIVPTVNLDVTIED